MTPTRKTTPRTEPEETLPEQEFATDAEPSDTAATDTASTDTASTDTASTDHTPTESTSTGPDSTVTEPAETGDAHDGASPDAGRAQPERDVQLTATQLLNDPLLGTHDDIIADLGIKLRWAAAGYALLGVIASWLIAAEVGIATKSGGAYGWAVAASILIIAATVWYIADVSTRFASVASYRRGKTPQAIARLERGAVVGLYSVIGAWIGVALGVLVVVSGTVTAVLTLALGAGGWVWFFGAVPVILLYLYAFGLLHYRLLEKARDAVA